MACSSNRAAGGVAHGFVISERFSERVLQSLGYLPLPRPFSSLQTPSIPALMVRVRQ